MSENVENSQTPKHHNLLNVSVTKMQFSLFYFLHPGESFYLLLVPLVPFSTHGQHKNYISKLLKNIYFAVNRFPYNGKNFWILFATEVKLMFEELAIYKVQGGQFVYYYSKNISIIGFR